MSFQVSVFSGSRKPENQWKRVETQNIFFQFTDESSDRHPEKCRLLDLGRPERQTAGATTNLVLISN
jgi:hypothetical protein